MSDARSWLPAVGMATLMGGALVLDLPRRLMGPTDGRLLTDALQLGGAAAVIAALGLPLERIGARWARARPAEGAGWWAGWHRAAATQAALGIVLGLLVLRAGRWMDIAGATAAVALGGLVLLRLQAWIGMGAGLDPAPGPRAGRRVPVRAPGAAFDGAWAGLPGQETLLMPASWSALAPGDREVRIRAHEARRPARMRTHAVALLAVVGLFHACAWTAGMDVSTPAGLVSIHLAVNLGVLLLAAALPWALGRIGPGAASATEEALALLSVPAGGALARLLPGALGRPSQALVGRGPA
jgi:hypothetical protein